MTDIELNNKVKLPSVGFGTFALKEGETKNIVKLALECGYRHIDTAQVYNNEAEVGDAIADWMKSSKTTRDKLFVTGKLWNCFHEEERVEEACRSTLKNLKLDYIDLYLIHFPTAFVYKPGPCTIKDKFRFLTYPIEDTWKAMEKLVEKGLAKSIGISNFNKAQVERILKICKIVPVVNQIESSVSWPNQDLIDFCKSKKIEIQAYSVLGNPGFFKDKKALMDSALVKELATKYKKTAAQICLKYCLQRKLCVLSKSSTEAKIKANLDIFSFELSPDDLKKLTLEKPKLRYLDGSFLQGHAEYPFETEN